MESSIDFSITYERYCKCTMNCHCGEHNVQEWTWDKTLESRSLRLSSNNLEVKFHPNYSSGSTGVRANKPLSKGCHHYWEIKMVTPVYGTDVMVGVGTKNACLSKPGVFSSLLGKDKESWGYSYHGHIHHDGHSQSYTSCFGQGSIVGVHLDTWRGTLQFFLNRKPLGMAFTNLRGLDLYPMTCSTSAESKMRLAFSCSMPASLQLDCLSKLSPNEKSYLQINFPGLRYLSQSVFAEVLKNAMDSQDARLPNGALDSYLAFLNNTYVNYENEDEDEDRDFGYAHDFCSLFESTDHVLMRC